MAAMAGENKLVAPNERRAGDASGLTITKDKTTRRSRGRSKRLNESLMNEGVPLAF